MLKLFAETLFKNATRKIFAEISISCVARTNINTYSNKMMQYMTLAGGNGLRMPVIGLGTWRAPPEEVEQSLEIALENGYRHIDTAFVYNNEEAIGNVLKRWISSEKVKRSDLFITTKLPSFGNRASDAQRFLKLSLERLKVDFVDLYLIHMPFALTCDEGTLQPAKHEDGKIKLDLNNNNLETWQAMEALVKSGLTKSIGLSNFNIEQVREIHKRATIKPSVLQVELHAYLQQDKLIEACKQLDIVVTAYSPLGSPGATSYFSEKYNFKHQEHPNILENPILTELTTKHSKTKGQILLKHLLQKGLIIIPKSSNSDRIKQNIHLFDFELDKDDVNKLNALDKGESGRIFTFLFFDDIQKHPNYPFLKN